MADELGPVELDFLASVEEAVAGIQELIGECRDLAGAARDASGAVAGIRDTSATTTVTADALKDALTDVRGDLAGIATTGVLTEGVLRGIRDDLADIAATGERAAATLAEIRDNGLQAAAAETAAATAAGASGLAGALANLGPGGVAGGIAILVGIVLALGSGLLGIIPAAAAAGLGLASLGILGMPWIKQVIAGLSATQAQLGQMPAGIVVIVDGIKTLEREFGNLFGLGGGPGVLGPQMEAIAGVLTDIATQLIPLIAPLARTAANAILTLVQGLDLLVASPGFHQFMAQLTALAGPAILTIGEGLGQIAVAIGKLLIALANPEALRTFKYLLEGIAIVITALAIAVEYSTKGMIIAFHAIAIAFDAVRHSLAASGDQIAAAWDWLQDQAEAMRHTLAAGWDRMRHDAASMAHDVAHYFDDVRHAAADLAHNVAAYFDEARANIARWADDVAAFLGRVVLYFAALPGKIMHTLAALPGELYAFGQHIIQGLINGALSMGGSLVSAGLHLAGSFLSSIGHFLGIGSPARATYEQGVWIGLGWANGILAAAPAIAAAVAHVSGLIGVPAGGLALAGTGALAAVPALASSGGRWQIDVNLHGLPPFGSPAMQQQFQQWMQAAALDFFTRNAGLGMTQYGRGLS